ncbi:MAG: U32 family peptidase [Candidatus Muirbacterium halophilum]|nr:U32 family peptidase [Candidatus Muirbacterium halophilum]MCK9474992.1 U32 family peptidase [Candidatus Muirbacterium halophilum]
MFLLPVGSIESLSSAINSKADGVYFGVESFNARKGALNFSLNELNYIVEILHQNNIKAFITVNILFDEKELEKLYEFLLLLVESAVDGIIIQDFAVYEILKKYLKTDIPLIASTQMNTNNLFAVKYLEQNNFDKTILARELSKEEIENISDNSNIKIEIFVHGALCYAYSGLCYMSQFIGKRSGNRGECAQPCRLEYNYKDKNGYFLSTKDLNLKSVLPDKVHTYKIEGRLKDKDYVGICSEVYKGFKEDFLLDLIFHREYTKGNFDIKGNSDVTDSFKAEKYGLFLGKMERKGKFYTLIPEVDIKVGDKLYFPDLRKGVILKGLWDGKNNFLNKSEKGKRVYIKADINGNVVDAYVNNSHLTDISIEKLKLKKQSLLKVNGNIVLKDNNIFFEYFWNFDETGIKLKNPLKKIIEYNTSFEQAKNIGLNHDYLKKIFEKDGDSLISLNIENSTNEENIFLKVSVLNVIRNFFIEEIKKNISFSNAKKGFVIKKNPELSIKLDNISQFEIIKKSDKNKKFNRIYIPAEEISEFYNNVIPYLPPVLDSFFYNFEEIVHKISELGYSEMLVGDHGGIYLCEKFNLKYSLDLFLNIRNSLAMDYYKGRNVENICISSELDSILQQELSGLNNFKTELMIYGRRNSMISVNCIDFNEGICKEKSDCRKTSTITNSRGDKFIIKCKDCHLYYYEDRIYGNIMNIKKINADILRIDAVCLDDSELENLLDLVE